MQLSRSFIGNVYRSRTHYRSPKGDVHRPRIGDVHRYWATVIIIGAALGMTILGLQAVGCNLLGVDTGHGAYNAMLRSALQSF
jgi:hypothetical protein